MYLMEDNCINKFSLNATFVKKSEKLLIPHDNREIWHSQCHSISFFA